MHYENINKLQTAFLQSGMHTPLAEEISNPVLKSVLKYGKHRSVSAIRNV